MIYINDGLHFAAAEIDFFRSYRNLFGNFLGKLKIENVAFQNPNFSIVKIVSLCKIIYLCGE